MRRLVAAVVIPGCLVGTLAVLSRPTPAQPRKPRNLVLVSIDTLRADHLSLHGYRRETAPGVASLARQGAVFLKTFACSSVTLPSHMTMLTGLHPRTHDVLTNSGIGSPQLVTLAEVLRAAGFSTAGFIGSSVLSAGTGLSQGFQVYDDNMNAYYRRGAFRGVQVAPSWRLMSPFDRGVQVPAEDVLDRALPWLRDSAKEPFFLFVHVYDPHSPYTPPPAYRRTFFTPGGDELQRLRDLYDCEIHYADGQLQRLWRELRRRNLTDSTLIVVTGDHGEGLGDHDYLLHAMRVYDEELHVPLVMSGPGVPKKRSSDIVDLADIFPTVLELLGVTAPPNEGRSLVPLLERENAKLGRGFAYGQRFNSRTPLLSYLLDGRAEPAPTTLDFVRSDKAKLLLPESRVPVLFNLEADPGETRDVAAQNPELTEQYVRWALRPLEKPLPTVTRVQRPLTPAERERLRALGYLAE